MKPEVVLVSACLLGVRCRYAGDGKQLAGLDELMSRAQLVPVCPEIMGGLSTPREPCERLGGRVVTRSGADASAAFARGAEETLRLAELYGAHYALLKERSPSCGAGEIYDGHFQKRTVPGNGVTAELLLQNGLDVFGESRIDELIRKLEQAEK